MTILEKILLVIGVFVGLIMVFFIYAVLSYISQMKKHQKKLDEKLKAWEYLLGGDQPRKELAAIGYKFAMWIKTSYYGQTSLAWPEFGEGGGSKKLFDKVRMFGFKGLSPEEKLVYTVVVGYVEDAAKWYGMTIEERKKSLKQRLDSDFFKEMFT